MRTIIALFCLLQVAQVPLLGAFQQGLFVLVLVAAYEDYLTIKNKR